MAIPTITQEARAQALEKARIVRQKRAAALKELGDGEVSPADFLGKIDDPVYGRVKVKSFLTSIPGIGKAKAAKIMAGASIAEDRRLAGLGCNQVQYLKDNLG